jgi:hypothetical protein
VGPKDYVVFMAWAAGLLLPGFLVLFPPSWLPFLPDDRALGVALLAVGSAWLAVIALADAVGDPSLKRPWKTLLWIVTRPASCLAASLGWWGLLAAEPIAIALSPWDVGYACLAFLGLRLLCVYLLLLSARALGVLGRAWTA